MSLNTMNSNTSQQQPNTASSNTDRDVESARRNYKAALQELTFNSKPIITNLTIMAQENQAAASMIVREIENQLRNNAPGQKLPVLYLIDSICKNVGGTYITNFGRNMVNVFLDAYALTDTTVRKSFERLLQTWKNGMPGGNPVFPRHIIESIERSVNYIREKTATSRYPHLPPSNKPNTSPSPSNSNINSGIHVNPNFINKEPRISSRDPRNRSPQMPPPEKTVASPLSSSNSLLSQLQSMLPATTQTQPTTFPNDNLVITQLIGQIRAILPTLPPAQASSIEQYLLQIAPPSAATVATPSPTLSNPLVFNNTPPLMPVSQPHRQPSISPVLSTASPVVASTAKVDTADLLKSLTSFGYLSPSPSIPPPAPVTDSSASELNKMGPFLLDSKDLQIARPGAIELLYSAEPLQCKQCGFRYPKTAKGQAKMDAHLDSHFRQNRKMKERVKRGLSRSWFVTVDEWINGEGGELMSQQMPTFLNDGHQVNKANEGATQSEEVINPDQYTVIVMDDSRKPCAICGERFVDFWNDDEEEWMYKNAVMIDDKIYHATCHADAVKSGSLVETDTEMQDVNNNYNTNKLDLKRKLDEDMNKVSKQARTE